MLRFTTLAAVVLMTLGVAAPAAADDTAEALTVFKEYVARSDRFDGSLADLYTDDASIRAKRLGPNGKIQSLTFTGAQWKALIRKAMPLAQQKGDRNTFQDVTAKPSESGISIVARRYSHLKNYTSPWAILVTKQPTGDWKISAEIFET